MKKTSDHSIRSFATERLMPVVVAHDPDQAESLREALKAGGINTAEVTLRTPKALEIIKIMAEDPEFFVGAGTVLSPKDASNAFAAGARFVVSPGLDLPVADECNRLGIPYFPGVATPTEIHHARDLGFTELKFFPAEALGGAQTLKALTAPFYDMRFIPTGGINLSNLDSYLAIPQVVAVGGSWIVADKYLNADDYSTITSLTREAIDHIQALSK